MMIHSSCSLLGGFAVLTTVLLLFVQASASFLHEDYDRTNLKEELWTAWKGKYNKTYQSAGEESERFAIWQDLLDEIKHHNIRYDLGLESYTKGFTAFSDMTEDEFMTRFSSSLRRPPSLSVAQLRDVNTATDDDGELEVEDLPTEVDWRKEGYVTEVVTQGKCGGCWAIATVGSLEGQWKKKSGKLVRLSPQQLIDCDTTQDGCKGGWPPKALVYTQQAGVEEWTKYPYVEKEQTCQYKAEDATVKSTGTYEPESSNDKVMQSMVAKYGPVVAVMDSLPNLKDYTGGIYYTTECKFFTYNHAVLVVGYGTDNGEDYWLIKNSWGTEWGLEGYFKIQRNANSLCGIADFPSVPLFD